MVIGWEQLVVVGWSSSFALLVPSEIPSILHDVMPHLVKRGQVLLKRNWCCHFASQLNHVDRQGRFPTKAKLKRRVSGVRVHACMISERDLVQHLVPLIVIGAISLMQGAQAFVKTLCQAIASWVIHASCNVFDVHLYCYNIHKHVTKCWTIINQLFNWTRVLHCDSNKE